MRFPALAASAALLLPAAPALLAPAGVEAQDNGFELTVENIMRGPEHVGEGPSFVRWTDDSRFLYFRWKPGGRDWHEPTSLWRVPASGGEPVELSDAAADSVAPLLANGEVSQDQRWRAVSSGGDLYLIDRRNLSMRRLTTTRANEGSPSFSRDGRALYYSSDNNLFRFDLGDGTIRQLTDIRTAAAPSEPRPAEGQRGFLEQQQTELFEHIRLTEEREARQRAERERREASDPLRPVYVGANQRVASVQVDPTGRTAIIGVAPTGGGNSARRVPIPFWVTESGYTETREVRTKVGDANPFNMRYGLLPLDGDQVTWLDLPAEAAKGDSAATRELAFGRFHGFSEDGSRALVSAGSYDNKHAWLWTVDVATGAMTLIARERDEAWLAGPCSFSCSGWLPDGRVYFASERTGYAHLYAAGADGSNVRALTEGPWEVHSAELSPSKDRFYLTTSEGDPHQIHFYHMGLNGGARTRITDAPGRQDVTVSPDGRRIAFIHSFANEPTDLYVADNRAGARATRITTSPTDAWASFDWIAPEIIRFPAEDGTQVPARVYRPEEIGAEPNGAAVIFVHGAGYLQNVHNWWSSYYREYMFHHLLASKGYVVLDIDYRGSAGYGRDWRTAIYRHMGGKDLSDQVDGSRWLTATYGIDPERIGIYGGSYGGFITLMALFTAPEYFGAGAALRSVTDWAHYNHGYTGRILNLPHEDSVAYRQSSPIYFADGLEDPLLIAHGMVDTNVHFSDVVRLAQRLIELGKTNWEMAVYPVEDHGFVEPASWTDEYRRILMLFERHLNPNGDPDSVR